MVQKWPRMVKKMLYWSFGIILDPLRPLWDLGKPAMFGHFWPQKGHFGPPCAHDWRMAMAKTASNQLGICLRIMHVQRIPKVSIFMAVTTKIVPEKAQKWPKMARFWPKWRYNGRAMARETFFYQCLWVTKFCAKFGRSRIPRTASVPNSFIILRCMWKEPAPLMWRYWWWFQEMGSILRFLYVLCLWKRCKTWCCHSDENNQENLKYCYCRIEINPGKLFAQKFRFV